MGDLKNLKYANVQQEHGKERYDVCWGLSPCLGFRSKYTKKDFGFRDSVNVKTGEIANGYLALDQLMGFLAICNYLTGGKMTKYIAPSLVKGKKALSSRWNNS
ncbi:hypothetical protein EOL96_04620 [Candidatus Saccharibacteria bacterium]|nr:hypothetical protein [Candidatus Saccharibacteria bacterium]